jgi:hypothetical protein
LRLTLSLLPGPCGSRMYGSNSRYADASADKRRVASAFFWASSDANFRRLSGESNPKNQSSASSSDVVIGNAFVATPTTQIETMAHAAISASDRTISVGSCSVRGKKRDDLTHEQSFFASDRASAPTASRIGFPYTSTIVERTWPRQGTARQRASFFARKAVETIDPFRVKEAVEEGIAEPSYSRSANGALFKTPAAPLATMLSLPLE